MIWSLSRRTPRSATISTLYGTIVAQARTPCFYRDYAVADTVNGRFDLIVLHLTLLFHRLASEPPECRALGQAVFDLFCKDMDHNLREMGVGDLAVPKKMRRIGAAFYGSLQSFEAAFVAGGGQALADAVAANIESAGGVHRLLAGRLAAYITKAVSLLSEQRCEAFMRGELHFPDPAVVHEHIPLRS